MSEPLRYDNPKIQRLRRLLGRRSERNDERAFVVEGPTLIAEAIDARWPVDSLYVPAGDTVARAAAEELSERAMGTRNGPPYVHDLASGVLERVASTETPRPLLAAVAMEPPSEPALTEVGFAVVVDRVADPGNLGTMLRSAEAAGVDVVVLTPGTVDPFNPKVLRASAGAVFHVPTIAATLDDVARGGLRRVGTSSHLGRPHTRVDWSGRVAIVVGNEAHGLADDTPVDEWVQIAHRGRAESLNVAMATTLLVFEAARHRP